MYAAMWGRAALIYFMIGCIMGLVMGITQQFQYAPVHAHINLLGWASMGLFAVLYRVFPAVDGKRVFNAVCFWIMQVGFLMFMISMFGMVAGNATAEGLLPLGGTLALLGALSNAVNLLMHVKAPADGTGRQAKAS